MGLLDRRKALVFGVANDHSIAWGIAKALHEQGAEVGFSSVESLIEKRVRPLAESIGSTFVEP
jgi:enoyl-[acyl-carrier protein] reductase I